MGLDMYLYRRRYVKNWDHNPPERKSEVTLTVGGEPIALANVTYVVEQVGYWRKANAIHAWFVGHAGDQRGDDCLPIYMEAEELRELRSLCARVLASATTEPQPLEVGSSYSDGVVTPIVEQVEVLTDATVAQELLPTASGFFFGGTEYTEYYLEDLRETIKILDAIPELAEGHEWSLQDGEFTYQASW